VLVILFSISMKSILLTLIAWVTLSNYFGYAQTSDWKVDASAYSHSMTVVGIIKVDRKESRNPNDKVAAFINGECRGWASPVYQPELDRYLVYLLVHNNGGSEKVSFKFFSAEKNETLTSLDSFPFVVDSLAGGVDAPYVWSNVVLNRKAEITRFSFPQQLFAPQFSDSSIYVSLNQFTDVRMLRPEFALSEGASLWVGLKEQVSGVSAQNFSQPVKYTVYSEDGKARRDYWIKPLVVLGEEPALSKSNFVVFPNPAGTAVNLQLPSSEKEITVEFTSASGATFSRKTLYSNYAHSSVHQVDISDLTPGMYVVRMKGKASVGLAKLMVTR
jgi:hypothetical protein